MRSPYLACGIDGTELSPDERALLEELQPGGLILFARNVQETAQLRELTEALQELPWRPHVAVDLEGGRVNRLRAVVGELPAPAVAASAGPEAVQALGAACGAVCAHFGIDVDYAPVLDLAREGGYLGGEDRCLASSPERVTELAEAFLSGLEPHGVAACLKHFPGLGSGVVDSHAELPILDDAVSDECGVFCMLAATHRAVMVAHALAPSLGEGLRPATLSPQIVALVRAAGCGPVLGDDLEMGALGAYGTIPERAAAALLAGCDQVLVCNALSERRAVVEHLELWGERSLSLRRAVERAASRVDGFARQPLATVGPDEVEARVATCWELCGGRP